MELLTMSLFWKWAIGIFLVLLLAAFLVLSKMAGSPKDAYGMLRYALPHMHRGRSKSATMLPTPSSWLSTARITFTFANALAPVLLL